MTIVPRVERRARWIATLVIVACAMVFAVSAWDATRTTPREEVVSAVRADEHVVGSRDASVKVIVYTDLECPHCKSFHERTLPQLRKQFGDSIAIIYRHFPLPSRPRGKPEAEAAECAYRVGGEGAFWAFVNAVFAETPSNNGLDPARLADIAQHIGIDGERFARCRERAEGAPRVSEDIALGSAAEVSVTPSIVIERAGHSETIVGNYPSRIVATIEYMFAMEGK